MQKQQFYANGKFLISGEYLVLKGARALAIPLKLGHSLHIETKEKVDQPILYWKSYENESLWFDITLTLPDFTQIETSDHLVAERLISILKTAYKNNPAFIKGDQSYLASSHMDFKKNWGLGSSSTLISNIANWTGINPYTLLKESFGGSGYDIACASADKPLFFTIKSGSPLIETANFNPSFKDNLYFVYLGKKQNSAESIQTFESRGANFEDFISEVSEISLKMSQTNKLSEFQKLMLKHEEIISGLINMKRIKEARFGDFNGEIKSLGGWGGDFILVATEKDYEYVKSYFNYKGLEVVFKYKEIALD